MMSKPSPEERIITRVVLHGVITPDVWQSILFRDIELAYIDPGPDHTVIVDVRWVPIAKNAPDGGQ